MIGIDTNILVRYFAQDDEEQASKATRLIESLSKEKKGFISLVSVIELVWVTQVAYGLSRGKIIEMLGLLFRVDLFLIENSDVLNKALRIYEKSNADFSDCLIAVASVEEGCIEVFTFDKKAAKSLGMTLL